MYLGLTIARQNRYTEAEAIFREVIQPHRYQKCGHNDGEHPDRLMAMWHLSSDCYYKQRRYKDALSLCQDIECRLKIIGGQGHPFSERVKTRMEVLEHKINVEGQRLQILSVLPGTITCV